MRCHFFFIITVARFIITRVSRERKGTVSLYYAYAMCVHLFLHPRVNHLDKGGYYTDIVSRVIFLLADQALSWIITDSATDRRGT